MHDGIIYENLLLISESLDVINYEKVDHEIIFDICENHLPKLRETIRRMLS